MGVERELKKGEKLQIRERQIPSSQLITSWDFPLILNILFKNP
jgi:hypothetical protein